VSLIVEHKFLVHCRLQDRRVL